MRYIIMASLFLSVGCWTVQPTALQKKERLDRANYQAKTFSGERFGGDNATLMADSLVFTFNEIEWRNAVHIDSLAEMTIASSGLGGLSGVLLGGAFGGALGAGIFGTVGWPGGDGNESLTLRRLLGGLGGFIVGVPVGAIFGAWVGTRLEKGNTLNCRNLSTREKIELLQKHLDSD